LANPKKRTKKGTKRARPVKAPKTAEVKYRRELNALTKKLRIDVNTQIVPLLRQLEPEYVNDAYAKTLEEAFDNLRKAYVDINEKARIVSNSFVDRTNTANKTRFYAAMEDAVGVNLQSIVQDEGLDDILTAVTRENVGLIRSIPEEYFKKIETLVFSNTTQGTKAGSMIKQIQKIGKTTTQRAKLIARDQSSKLNSALSQQRQQNLGVEEYVWRTSGDERVRHSHKSKNGKVFRWDKPPKDTGHPGQDIQCRCVAQPIIKI
jgi:SPP1 gp7 family putative phage head morphogenesis protein